MNATEIRFTKDANGDRMYVHGDTTYQVEGRTGNYTVMMFAPDVTIMSPFMGTMDEVRSYVTAAIERPDDLRTVAGRHLAVGLTLTKDGDSRYVVTVTETGKRLGTVDRDGGWWFARDGVTVDRNGAETPDAAALYLIGMD